MTVSSVRSHAATTLLLGAALFFAIVAVHAFASIGVAHGDPASDAPVVERVLVQTAPAAQAVPESNTALVLAIVALAIAGLNGLHSVLVLIAPRTKNTWDDGLRDDIAAIKAFIQGLGLPLPPAAAAASRPASTDELKRSADGKFGAGLALLLCAGLAVTATQASCSGTAGQRGANAAGAFIDCESPDLDAGLLAEAIGVAKSAVMKWISGSGDVDASGLKAEAAPLKSNLMRCAFEAAVAAVATPAPKQEGAAMAAGLEVDGAALRARYAQVKAELGWPAIRVER